MAEKIAKKLKPKTTYKREGERDCEVKRLVQSGIITGIRLIWKKGSGYWFGFEVLNNNIVVGIRIGHYVWLLPCTDNVVGKIC